MPATALLVIDLQRGAFDGLRCPPVDSANALIAAACTLVDAARAGGVPVFWVHHGEDAGPFEQGSPHWEWHEALVPAAGEPRIAKRESSAFAGTDLEERLRERGITRLVLCGLQSEFCVSNTARSAQTLGFDRCLARGAHGTWPDQGQTAAQIRARVEAEFAAAGTAVVDLADAAAALRVGGAA